MEIYRGEVVGIIGRNGAGRSTLLKVISRVLKPTKGRVVVKGHLAPLLESAEEVVRLYQDGQESNGSGQA